MKITGAQITAARNLLKITQEELAQASGVAEHTLYRFETDKTFPHQRTLSKVLAELERRGIEFTNGTGIGVRLNFEKAAEFARTISSAQKGPNP